MAACGIRPRARMRATSGTVRCMTSADRAGYAIVRGHVSSLARADELAADNCYMIMTVKRPTGRKTVFALT